jgi:hypothetical protein
MCDLIAIGRPAKQRSPPVFAVSASEVPSSLPIAAKGHNKPCVLL